MDTELHIERALGLHRRPCRLRYRSAGLWSVKLDGGRGTYSTQLLSTHDDNKPADDFGRFGAAFKARYSNTEIKAGEWNPVLPILSSDNGRGLTQTFQGGMLTSKEIKNVTLYAGQMRQNSPRNDASMQDMTIDGISSSGSSDRFNVGGVELYTLNEGRTMLSAWFAQLEDSTNSATSRSAIPSRLAKTYRSTPS